MAKSVLFFHFIADGVYHIYKLSSKAREKITLVDAGMAYHKGNYTDNFKRKIAKYALTNEGMHTTSDSFGEFCSRLYLDSKQVGITRNATDFPEPIFEVLKEMYEYRHRNDD